METNWDEVFMNEVRTEGREREKKCHKMFGNRKDERLNILLQLSFYVLKIKSKEKII
jgi:hypothetical protein